MNSQTNANLAVAMSGGVDSSVAAALCVEAGHDVFGVMLRLWSEPGASADNRCCTLSAVDDARAVAEVLGIPFSVIDVAAVFKERVVDPFVARSLAGDTPNPCLSCNRGVRFGYLLAQARALGADALATGHYARVELGDDGRPTLHRGADRAKDQSYVLHVLDADQLSGARFPVGAYTKAEVRDLARRFGLPVASRQDSVDLCWVGQGGVPGFLERTLPPGGAKPGPIEHLDGRALGEHRGLIYYTLGQRKGLGVSVGEPIYVVRRDTERNALVVGPVDPLMQTRVRARDFHWIAGRPPDEPLRVEAQIRYRAPAAPATLVPGGGGHVDVTFERAQRAPTPGQALVAYQGDRCLGGGTIVDPLTG